MTDPSNGDSDRLSVLGIVGLVVVVIGAAAVSQFEWDLPRWPADSSPAERRPGGMVSDASFEECSARIREVAARHGVPPIVVVDTELVRVVRFHARDGSVLVTCSRPDRKVQVSISPN